MLFKNKQNKAPINWRHCINWESLICNWN